MVMESPQAQEISANVAGLLVTLATMKIYHGFPERLHLTLFLLMPDHVHAVLSFPRNKSMSEIIRDWKRFHRRANHVVWQEGYFDHRLRADERGTQLSAKLNYIRQNPVAAGLCARAEDWPWVIDPFGHEQ